MVRNRSRSFRTNRGPLGLLCIVLAVIPLGCKGDDDDGTNGAPGSSAGSGGASGTAGEQAGVECVGVQVDEGVEPGAGGADCPNCTGSTAPAWELEDFQPQSCGYGLFYGLEQFRGTTTLVGLFSGWCDFCQSQTVELERMRQELLAEGRDVQFVIVNSADAVDSQQPLVDRCAFPLFQDTAEVNAFVLHGGAKDDLIVYDREGRVAAFLPGSGEEGPTILTSPPGYENVKSKILAAE